MGCMRCLFCLLFSAALLQAQTILKEELLRSVTAGTNLNSAILSRQAAIEKTKKDAKETAKERDAIKHETKR